jgi:hypothetical protein
VHVVAFVCDSMHVGNEIAGMEAMAAWQAVEFSVQLGLRKEVFEGNALEVVQAIINEELQRGRYGHVVQDIKQSLKGIQAWRIVHTLRETNEVAHRLTKLSLVVEQRCNWIKDYPHCIHDYVFTEQVSA